MAYISREKAIEIVKSGGYWEQEDMEVAVACIEQTPTADVVEVKHGEWKINPDGYYPFCSCCGHEPENRKMSAFCPGCGADMRGKQR